MRKIILTLAVMLIATVAGAKVVNITLDDNSVRTITTSEISAIDFNKDGTVTITTYDGEVLENTSAQFEELIIDNREMLLPGEKDVDFTFEYDGLSLGTRKVKEYLFLYPTVDPWGDSITMSGRLVVPLNILEGKNKSEGILLFNHYTIFNSDEAPTRGFNTLEAMFLANPLNPNYIIVESDFYGFGVTERFPQAYLQDLANAHASIDCYLTGRRLLTELGIDYGPLTFNVGYSSAGFDALATQKLRDMEFSDKISFDKTFSGGGPSDINKCYSEYVRLDTTAYNAVLALLMVATNETQKLGLKYEDVFQPYIAENIPEWIHSKNYTSGEVCDLIGREKKVHEILTAPYCDLKSAESKAVQALFVKNSLATGWKPDPSQRLYIFHSRGDDYVPVQSARPLLSYLSQYGYEPSIIPGKTNLQTNFVVPKLGHLLGTVVYLVQSVAAIKAWPRMYENGELKPEYAELLSRDMSPVDYLRALDQAGFNCRPIIQAIVDRVGQGAQEGGTMSEIVAAVMARLKAIGIDEVALMEMSHDSGVDVVKMIQELIVYLNEKPEPNPDQEGEGESEKQSVRARIAKVEAAMDTPLTPEQEHVKQLSEWLVGNGVKIK